MATIRVTPEELVIEMHGIDKFWALRSSMSIPLAHVSHVEARPKDAHVANMKGAVRVGSYVPGYVLAGYYYMPGVAPNASAVFESLQQAEHAISAWPEGEGTPREQSHKDKALEHLTRATEAMRAAAQAAGVDPSDTGRGWAFYELHDPEKTIGFDVAGEKIRRVVIEIQDKTPEEAVAEIEAALKRR
jgi:hypothetical protein